jgi:hypothetical protein
MLMPILASFMKDVSWWMMKSGGIVIDLNRKMSEPQITQISLIAQMKNLRNQGNLRNLRFRQSHVLFVGMEQEIASQRTLTMTLVMGYFPDEERSAAVKLLAMT